MMVRLDEGVPPDLVLEPPALDEAIWPLERQAKAWRNFSVAYVGGRLFWLIEVLGESQATKLFEHAYRLTLLQNRERIPATLGIETSPGPLRAAQLWSAWHQSWGDEVTLEAGANDSIVGEVTRSRIHEVGEFSPPANPIPTAIEHAAMQAWAAVIAYDCPGVKVDAQGSMSSDVGWQFSFGN